MDFIYWVLGCMGVCLVDNHVRKSTIMLVKLTIELVEPDRKKIDTTLLHIKHHWNKNDTFKTSGKKKWKIMSTMCLLSLYRNSHDHIQCGNSVMD
jgi:hypothetical protein